MQTLTIFCAIVSISFAVETEIWMHHLANPTLLKFFISDDKVQHLYEILNLKNNKSLELNINFLFDLVLEGMEPYKRNTTVISDFKLPEFDVNFHHNYAIFEKGTVVGIGDIERDGDSLAGYSLQTSKLNFVVPIKFTGLQYQYQFQILSKKMERCGTIQGNLTGFRINTGFSFNFNTKHLSAVKYIVTDPGKITVTFKNESQEFMDILNKISKTEIQPSIIKVVNKVIKAFYNAVTVLINDSIDDYIYGQNSSAAPSLNFHTLDPESESDSASRRTC